MPPSDVQDIAVPLPPHLRRFGETVRATLVGDNGPAVALLGGISAGRFPCVTSDGALGWWRGLAGAGCRIDPAQHRILGFDFIADETGTAAPTPFDQADALALVLDAFGIDQLDALVGASYGGMIGLSFAERFPERVGRIAIISADASPHPTSTAARELQRRIVRFGMEQGRGLDGLSLARGLAMLTYRSPEEFDGRFDGGIDGDDPLTCSGPGAYLRARGEAYGATMSPGRFLSLSASIDRHRCAPEKITAPATLIGASSDQLVPPVQMQRLADRLAGPVTLHMLPCLYGHDMFLKETDKIAAALADLI